MSLRQIVLKIPLRYVKPRSRNQLRDEEVIVMMMVTEILVTPIKKYNKNIPIQL